MNKPSARAEIITRRTYNRPLNKEGTLFESWDETVDRVVGHQNWLWTRAKGNSLSETELQELEDLRDLMLCRKISMSGRTLWLGGTDVAKKREASQFNCSFIKVETVYDIVDVLWLLLQGCGVGFTPVIGTLNGFMTTIKDIEVIRSIRTEKGGLEYNEEFWDPSTKVWTIRVGDSAEAWAKSIGKLLAGKIPADKLIFDFSNIRPAGERLEGYGWISSGDDAICKAYLAIAKILNKRAGSLLTAIDILDICNWLGTVLSSRRSAEIALLDSNDPEWKEFATAKKDFWIHGNEHRCQSNNSLVFYTKPAYNKLREIFDLIEESGGSEPGFINGESALKRAPWFKGSNPSLRKGTRVFTSKGIIPIELLEDDFFEVYTLDGQLKDAGCRLSGKNKRLYKITLEGGHEYFATKEHTWPIYRKTSRGIWCDNPFKVETTDILPDDYLVNSLRDYLYPDAKVGNYSDGFFIGWLLSDGWITTRSDNSKKQIGLIINEDEYSGIIRKVLEGKLIELGSTAKFYKSSNNSKSFELNTQNEAVWSWLESFGVTSKEALPSSLFSSDISEDFRRGFIDATFSADGSIESTKGGCKIRIGFSTKSEERAIDLCDLLGFYGIKTSISCSENTSPKFPNGKDYEKTYICYTVRIGSFESVTHFNKLFTLSSKKKNERLSSLLSKPSKEKMCGKIRILSVEETDLYEDVWDIGVYDTTHTFQLSHGITGNCAEILLGNKSFCNLVEIDIGKFKGNSASLKRAIKLAARANYRQTCVNLRDGILQESWHLNNEFLRLCGVGLTGIARREDLKEYDYQELQRVATSASYGMADELGLQQPKNTTTVKPSGTLSKIMDTTEGVHRPLGRYIFNNVNFSKHDPILDKLRHSGYKVIPNPVDPEGILVTFPVCWDDIPFSHVNGVEVNIESAIDQLNRYKHLQSNWTQQNTSVTISYSLDEVESIIDWLLVNWDSYVGVSFIYRTDPTKTAKDLGYLYLPQEVVTKEVFDEYVSKLSPVDLDNTSSFSEILDQECAGGVCPVK
ncbi:ribonucleoside-triphosphate reductase [Caudoviricetes sp.]|nr:ribonucleoside-triphosphate reductase [Caudoviricetes sp.]